MLCVLLQMYIEHACILSRLRPQLTKHSRYMILNIIMYKQRNISLKKKKTKKIVFWSPCCHGTTCLGVWLAHVCDIITVRKRTAFYSDWWFLKYICTMCISVWFLSFFFAYSLPVQWFLFYFCSKRVHSNPFVTCNVFGYIKYLNAINHE